LIALLAALASNGTKLVLIERFDRPARDVMVQVTIIGDLHKRGFQIISAMEPDLCADDPSRKLMRQIFGGIAEYEKTMSLDNHQLFLFLGLTYSTLTN